MPMERMSMRHVLDCVRLKNSGMSTREIARRVGAASSTVDAQALDVARCAVRHVAPAARRQRRLHVPPLQQFDRKPRLPQRCVKPLRQWPGLQPDPLQAQSQRAEPGDQCLRLTGIEPPERSCRSRRQHIRSSIPTIRQFRHNRSWSSLNDAWSGPVRLR